MKCTDELRLLLVAQPKNMPLDHHSSHVRPIIGSARTRAGPSWAFSLGHGQMSQVSVLETLKLPRPT